MSFSRSEGVVMAGTSSVPSATALAKPSTWHRILGWFNGRRLVIGLPLRLSGCCVFFVLPFLILLQDQRVGGWRKVVFKDLITLPGRGVARSAVQALELPVHRPGRALLDHLPGQPQSTPRPTTVLCLPDRLPLRVLHGARARRSTLQPALLMLVMLPLLGPVLPSARLCLAAGFSRTAWLGGPEALQAAPGVDQLLAAIGL